MSRSFREILRSTLNECDLVLSEEAITKLNIYNDMLIEYNRVMNLTALTEPREVALKHFCDSLMVLKYAELPGNADLIDIGTGAGFPGLVLKIARPDLNVYLLDSLQKRLSFLEEVCCKAQISGVRFIHSRAEDGGRKEELREKFDVAVSRAVAPLHTLCEYCLPYVKPGGVFLAMKGKEWEEEHSLAQNATELLGGTVEKTDSFILSDAGQRAIIRIRKTSSTPDRYPRTGKKIKNKPL